MIGQGFSAEQMQRIAEAKARLKTWTIPELRHICVEGLVAGGWIRFEYDRDGYLRVYDRSDNVRLIESVTGKPTPPWTELNAAWELAYAMTPKSASHVSNSQPVGTELEISRYVSGNSNGGNGRMERGHCVVIGYVGQYCTVRFDDGDVRSHPMPPFRDPAI